MQTEQDSEIAVDAIVSDEGETRGELEDTQLLTIE